MTNAPPQPDTSKQEDWTNKGFGQDWYARFHKLWFAKPEETTLMNWDGMFNPRYDVEEFKQVIGDMLIEFIQQEIDRAVLEVFDMLGTGHDLFLEWREYVKKQYDNPEKETRVVDSFEYWLDRKIDLIKFKIKNG